jgi:hypothetical protein
MTEQEIDIVVQHLRVQAVHARWLAGGGEYQTTQNSRHWANAAKAFEEAANIMADPAAEITRLRAELAEAREAVGGLVEAVRGAFVMQNATPIGVDTGEMLGSVWPMIQAHDKAVKKGGGGAKAGGDARPTGALPTEETGAKP